MQAGYEQGDLLPANRSIGSWNFPNMIPAGDEESSIKKTKFTEAQIAFVLKQGGRRRRDCRSMPEGCDQRCDCLQLAQEVRWADAFRDEAAAATRGENAKLKRIVADLSLDKAT